MKQFLILLVCLMTLPALAQKKSTKQPTKTEDPYTVTLTSYLKTSPAFLTTDKLSASQMKKMMADTFRDKNDDTDFVKALNTYFPSMYDKRLVSMLQPFFCKELTEQQLESLINYSSSDAIKKAKEGIKQCGNAAYCNKMADATLTSTAQKTGKKKKKLNVKKFVSDCPEDYRAALERYSSASGCANLSELNVNAIYHTVSAEDLNAYTEYLGSDVLAANKKVEKAIADDIYNLQSTCVSDFQTWSYKAYPSLFTKKQAKPMKGKGKGKKGKNTTTTQDNDVIIDGGILH